MAELRYHVQRVYQWILVDITATEPETPGCHRLLVRRSIRTGELAFCRCYTPTPVPLATLVRVAGRRWTSWRRWTILAMLAHAFLAVMTATARADTHRARLAA